MDEPWIIMLSDHLAFCVYTELHIKGHILNIPFIWNVHNMKIYKDRKISGYLGFGEKGREMKSDDL